MIDSKPDWFNMIARGRGVPDGWSWFHSEFKGDRQHGVFLVKGACIAGTYSRGKNKGRPKRDPATTMELVITRDDLNACKRQWSSETGKCHDCCGDGKTVASVSMVNGVAERTYRDCRTCKATGVYQP